MSAFGGFPPETISFLRELRINNRKEWFDAHRRDYEAYWLAPAKGFVVARRPAAGRARPTDPGRAPGVGLDLADQPRHPFQP